MLETPLSSSLTPTSLTESHAWGLVLFTLMISLALSLQGCASLDAHARQTEADSAARDIWHAKRLETLAAEDGWLTLVGQGSQGGARHGSGKADVDATRSCAVTSLAGHGPDRHQPLHRHRAFASGGAMECGWS